MATKRVTAKQVYSLFQRLSPDELTEFKRLTGWAQTEEMAGRFAKLAVTKHFNPMGPADVDAHNLICRLRREGMSYGQIALALKREGIKQSTGLPWTDKSVGTYCRRWGRFPLSME